MFNESKSSLGTLGRPVWNEEAVCSRIDRDPICCIERALKRGCKRLSIVPIVRRACCVFVGIGNNIKLVKRLVASIVKREEELEAKRRRSPGSQVEAGRRMRLAGSNVECKGVDVCTLHQGYVRPPLFWAPFCNISDLYIDQHHLRLASYRR